MDIEDIPDLKGNQYPARISVSVTSDAKKKLEYLKKNRKDTAELVRRLLDEFFEKVDFGDAV